MAFRVKKRSVIVKWDGSFRAGLKQASLDRNAFADKAEAVSHKSPRIAALIADLEGQQLDAHYLGFFECFNRQLFFEAHEVLEELWLAERGGRRDLFYKGLIQLAGAFVHVQKSRPGPAAALFRLAQKNLEQYLPAFEDLEVSDVITLIEHWVLKVTSPSATASGQIVAEFPILKLSTRAAGRGLRNSLF